MSADNWTICPKCAVLHQKKQDAAKKKAMVSYGKVSAEEWLELQKKAQADEPLAETLSEYYEIGIQDGAFFVGYGASCRECGFKFDYKHEQDVEIT